MLIHWGIFEISFYRNVYLSNEFNFSEIHEGMNRSGSHAKERGP